jgi:hypothetical protein
MAYLEGLRRYATAKISKKIVQSFKNQSSTNQTYRVSPSTQANKSIRRYPIARPPSRTNRGPLPANRHFFKRLSETDSKDAASEGRTTSGGNDDSFLGLTRAPIIEGFGFETIVALVISSSAVGLGITLALVGRVPSANPSPNNPSWRASLSTLSRLTMRHLLAKGRSRARIAPTIGSLKQTTEKANRAQTMLPKFLVLTQGFGLLNFGSKGQRNAPASQNPRSFNDIIAPSWDRV